MREGEKNTQKAEETVFRKGEPGEREYHKPREGV